MSEASPRPKDPVLRFLGGCALVAAGIVVLLMIAAVAIGWRLTRDVAPGRPVEAFLAGDETRYWCFDLKPEDPGIAAFVANVQQASDQMRDATLEHSPLRFLPFRPRGNRIEDILPLKLELAQSVDGWSARASFSKQIFRIRAAVAILRFVMGRDPEAPAGPDGIPFASFHDPHSGTRFAMTMVGNRLLAASAPKRLTKALAIDRAEGSAIDPALVRLHDAIRLEGEDGWAFAPGPSVVSFDVTPDDALRFRIVEAADDMDPDKARATARRWISVLPEDEIDLDPGTPSRRGDGLWLVEGKVLRLSQRVHDGLIHVRERDASGSPSATPTPPSLPRP